MLLVDQRQKFFDIRTRFIRFYPVNGLNALPTEPFGPYGFIAEIS